MSDHQYLYLSSTTSRLGLGFCYLTILVKLAAKTGRSSITLGHFDALRFHKYLFMLLASLFYFQTFNLFIDRGLSMLNVESTDDNVQQGDEEDHHLEIH